MHDWDWKDYHPVFKNIPAALRIEKQCEVGRFLDESTRGLKESVHELQTASTGYHRLGFIAFTENRGRIAKTRREFEFAKAEFLIVAWLPLFVEHDSESIPKFKDYIFSDAFKRDSEFRQFMDVIFEHEKARLLADAHRSQKESRQNLKDKVTSEIWDWASEGIVCVLGTVLLTAVGWLQPVVDSIWGALGLNVPTQATANPIKT